MKTKKTEPAAEPIKIRLHKFMAMAGVASRRKSEELIKQGKVTVNGQCVTEMGVMVDPAQDKITVDGKPLFSEREELVYIMLNKPKGVLSDTGDESARRTIFDIVGSKARLFAVGRLDLESEGLILLTNDGELAHHLTHPRYEHEKEYEVLVEGQIDERLLEQWRKGGILLEDKPSAPAVVERIKETEEGTLLRVTLREGRKRQIRKIAAALGHPALSLVRVRLASLNLGRLKPGEWRPLHYSEIKALKRGK